MDVALEKIRTMIEKYHPQNTQEKNDRKQMLATLETASRDILFRAEPNHFTVSAFVLNEKKDKVLFAFHRIYQSWAWLGGHLDGDQDPLFAIQREIQEESGLTFLQNCFPSIASLEILPVLQHIKHGKIVAAHQHFNLSYLFIGRESDPIRPKEDENKAVAWLPLSQLEEKVQEKHMLPIYKKLMERAM